MSQAPTNPSPTEVADRREARRAGLPPEASGPSPITLPASPPDMRCPKAHGERRVRGNPLALEVDELLEDLVRGGDDTRVRLEAALRHDEVGELSREVNI